MEWLSKQDNGLDDRTKHVVINRSNNSRTTLENKELLEDGWMDFLSCVEPLTSLLEAFRSAGREKSKVFLFWEDYVNMVLVLLQFIKAERTGNWKLHLTATAAMVPHFFAMDRINYARWLPVYLSNMNMLETSHPEVYKEFINGNHSVSHSKEPFAQVWTDMALEQSINLDSKSKGGIMDMSTKEDAVDRWFLTIHDRAAMTQAVKAMCGFENSTCIGTHKDTGPSRLARDEKDVQKLVESFSSGLLSNPFHIPDDIDDESKPIPLSNLASGVVLPDGDADRLMRATELGRQSMERFISSRVKTNETNFWDPIQKLKIKSFCSMAKTTVMSTSQKEEISLVNADRERTNGSCEAQRHRS